MLASLIAPLEGIVTADHWALTLAGRASGAGLAGPARRSSLRTARWPLIRRFRPFATPNQKLL
jgi:hypothetical protein